MPRAALGGWSRVGGRVRLLLRLPSNVDGRSCWQLAEQAGDATPRGMQRLLGEARWDADAVRDDLRSYVVKALGDPVGALVIDGEQLSRVVGGGSPRRGSR